MSNDFLTIFDVCNYISLANNELNRMVSSSEYFKESNNITPYSFTPSKLQKLFIIAVLKYLNTVSDENPVVDLNNINIVNYGFSIDYCSNWLLIVDPFYEKTLHKDQDMKLYSFLNDNYTKADVINALINSKVLDTSLSNGILISYELRYCIIDTILEFGLYKSKTLGILLNVLKNSSYIPPAAHTVSIHDLYLATKSIPYSENILIEFIKKGEI